MDRREMMIRMVGDADLVARGESLKEAFDLVRVSEPDRERLIDLWVDCYACFPDDAYMQLVEFFEEAGPWAAPNADDPIFEVLKPYAFQVAEWGGKNLKEVIRAFGYEWVS